MVAKMLTMLLRSSAERSVMRGTDTEEVITNPKQYVGRLIAVGLLPRDAYIERVPDPVNRTVRSALFNVMPLEFFKRVQDIIEHVDMNFQSYPLDGDQLVRHLGEMIARAGAHSPELYERDASAQLMFVVVGKFQVFLDLIHGEVDLFETMVKALGGRSDRARTPRTVGLEEVA